MFWAGWYISDFLFENFYFIFFYLFIYLFYLFIYYFFFWWWNFQYIWIGVFSQYIVYRQAEKFLVRYHRCARWSGPLLFVYGAGSLYICCALITLQLFASVIFVYRQSNFLKIPGSTAVLKICVQHKYHNFQNIGTDRPEQTLYIKLKIHRTWRLIWVYTHLLILKHIKWQ